MKNYHILLIFSILIITGCSRDDEPSVEKEGRIIILMYHRIVKGEASNLYERSLADFEDDLQYLQKNNISVISFHDLLNISGSARMPAGNSAIITFDDGDSSWFTVVQPLLKKYKVKATFFLWVYMIGRDSFISWQEVELMSHYTLQGGVKPFTFGSHSYSHPYLCGSKAGFTDPDDYIRFLDYELGESKRIIEEHSPVSADILALPFGDGAGDEDIISAAKRNGYNFIRTSVYGTIDDPDADLFILPSLPMLNDTESDEIGYYLDQD